jgi:hypothetical protein
MSSYVSVLKENFQLIGGVPVESFRQWFVLVASSVAMPLLIVALL